MKARVIVLLSAIVIVAVCIAALGSYIKYEILQPLDLDDDYNVMELPFQVLTDDGLKFAIEFAIMMEQMPTEDPDNTTESTWEDFLPTPPPTDPTTRPTIPGTTPGDTEPTDPTDPTDPLPTDPKPTEPKPTEPKPTQPKPTEPKKESYTYPDHDFSEGAVSDEWFENVLFIGESRTVGLRDYARTGNAAYFCGVGASVFNIMKKEFSDGSHFSKQTLESLLSSQQFDKVFINLGINECGYPASTIIAAYEKIIAMVQKYQPDAKIILQGVLTVTEKYAGSKDHFKPKSIHALNKKIKKLADDTTIFYIDANPYFTDPDGYLYKDITGDGCHFTGKYYKEWAKWISFAVGQLGI